MSYTIAGEIKEIKETKTYGANGFRKREIILISGDRMYPQYLKIEFLQDKVDILDDFNEGDLVKIAFELRGREWENSEGETIYFNSINGWKIEKASSAASSSDSKTQSDEVEKEQKSNDSSDSDNTDDDDLPF